MVSSEKEKSINENLAFLAKKNFDKTSAYFSISFDGEKCEKKILFREILLSSVSRKNILIIDYYKIKLVLATILMVFAEFFCREILRNFISFSYFSAYSIFAETCEIPQKSSEIRTKIFAGNPSSDEDYRDSIFNRAQPSLH